MVFRLGRPASGVILLRGVGAGARARSDVLAKVTRTHGLEESFATVRKDRVKIRRLPTKR